MAEIEVFIPLAQYEKDLLHQFVSTTGWESNETSAEDLPDIQFAFLRWDWTKRFSSAIQEALTEDDWKEFHHGDWAKAWPCIERALPISTSRSTAGRFNDLRQANGQLERSTLDTSSKVVYRMVMEDIQDWQVVSSLVRFYRNAEPAYAEIENGLPEGALETPVVAGQSISNFLLSTLGHLNLGDVHNETSNQKEHNLPVTHDAVPRSDEQEEGQRPKDGDADQRPSPTAEASDNELITQDQGEPEGRVDQSAVEQREVKNTKLQLTEEELERFRDRNWTFELWSLLQSCALLLRRTSDTLERLHHAISKTGFYELHDKVKNGYVRNENTRKGIEGGSGKWAVTAMGLRLVSFDDDPLKLVEDIPWSELHHHPAPPQIDKNFAQKRFVYWAPVLRVPWEKHLFTEDDVFRSCIETKTPFRGYLFGDHVVFALSPIETFHLETGLHGGIRGYWNDCAITVNPETDEYFLLETVPGLKFRQIYKQANEVAALKYFRALIEHRNEGRSDSLQDVLGLHFQPIYENLLTLIPHEQISFVDPIPLGEGSRGVVYKALWSRPPGIGTRERTDVPVALKSIKLGDSEHIERFMKELDSTFAAVSGRGVRVVELYGLLKTPATGNLGGNIPTAKLRQDTLFFVLEFAEHGKVLDYLRKSLRGDRSDWVILLDLMGDITTGVNEIHQRGIVHRDLHAENLFVVTRSYTREAGPIFTENCVLIGDLGESQLISKQPDGRTYYGNEAFWAPEVRSHQLHSPASDVFAMACLFSDMISVHWEYVTRETAKADKGVLPYSVPKLVVELIVACLLEDPELRPTSQELSDVFDDLKSDKETEEGQLIAIDLAKYQDLVSQRRKATASQDDIVT